MVKLTSQEPVTSEKKRGPAPQGKGAPILVRLQPDDLEVLDLWIAKNKPGASRPDAIRRILRLWR